MEDFRIFGIVWNTVKRLFNKDHEVKVLIVYEGGNTASLSMTSNSLPMSAIKIVEYQVVISSPAGQLVGKGSDLLNAYTDAIKTIQK